MKRLISGAVTVLLTTLLIAAVPTDAEAKIYDDTLRLHILANSDSEDDQRLKLTIRDRLLLKYGDILKTSQNAEDATKCAAELIFDIKNDVEQWVSELGFSYEVNVTVTKEWYDRREYENLTLPAGIYNSLRVLIGDAVGKNWWCIMYPPLCTSLASESAPPDDSLLNYTDEEIRLIGGEGYNLKFKILELLSQAFAKNG